MAAMSDNPQPPDFQDEQPMPALDPLGTPSIRHLPRRNVRARFQTTNHLVVLAALAVMAFAAADVFLQLVAYAVLTAR